MSPTIVFDDRDAAIRLKRIALRQTRQGPRIGDFVCMPDGTMRRWARYWGDSMQPTLGDDVSFYFNRQGGMNTSGAMDSAIPLERIKDTGEIQDGSCWFFHHDITHWDSMVMCTVPCRVYAVEGDAT